MFQPPGPLHPSLCRVNHHVKNITKNGLGFSVKDTSKVVVTIGYWNFQVIFIINIHINYKINVTGVVSTLWSLILFGWNKAAEKRLYENKTSREILVQLKYNVSAIKYNVKLKTNLEC